MMIDHRLLDRTWFRFAPETFDRDDVRAVELEEELDAGVDRSIYQPTSVGGHSADEHGAGAAITFAADDLRASEAACAAKEVGQRREGIAPAYLVAATVHPKEHVIEHAVHAVRRERSLGRRGYSSRKACASRDLSLFKTPSVWSRNAITLLGGERLRSGTEIAFRFGGRRKNACFQSFEYVSTLTAWCGSFGNR
jgi:hypothetical protein